MSPLPDDVNAGAHGWLELRTRPLDEHGIIEHAGDYRYLGDWDGMHVFAEVDTHTRVYLHPEEVIVFEL